MLPHRHPRLGLAVLLLPSQLWLGACQTPAPPPPAAGDAALEEAAPAQAAAGLPAGDPQAIYAQCRERVEGPEAQGECTVDADCTKGGCSGEVCATPAALADMMSTCEVLPCFQVLQDCGCHDGRCTWTVGAPAADPSTPPIVLPPRDQLPAEGTAPDVGEGAAPAPVGGG